MPRFGHSAVVYNGSMYIYGGFNGQTKSDILVFTPGECSHVKVRIFSTDLIRLSCSCYCTFLNRKKIELLRAGNFCIVDVQVYA